MPSTAHATITAIDAVDCEPSERELALLRAEIDRLDAEIVENVRKRVEITRRAGQARIGAGLPQVTQHAEMDVLRHFERHLGSDGVSLGMVLLRLGRKGVPGQGR